MNTDARLNLDLDEVDWDARDEHGVLLDVPSAIREVCTGPNPNCRRAHAEGRGVHFISPRVQAWGAHLVLPTYHFRTEDDAVRAFDDARRNAGRLSRSRITTTSKCGGLPAWVPFELDRWSDTKPAFDLKYNDPDYEGHATQEAVDAANVFIAKHAKETDELTFTCSSPSVLLEVPRK